MKHARFLLFGLLLLPCAALAAEQTPAFKSAADWSCNPSGFGNLIATSCWFYGGSYLIYAAIKARKRHQARLQQPDSAVAPAGIGFFITSGLMLVAYPFLRSFMYSMDQQLNSQIMPAGATHGYLPQRNDTALLFETPLMLLALAAPFLPWLMMIFRKNLRHLRRQGVIGLGLVFAPPCILFIASFLIIEVFG